MNARLPVGQEILLSSFRFSSPILGKMPKGQMGISNKEWALKMDRLMVSYDFNAGVLIISEYMENNTADSKLIFRRNMNNVKLRVPGMKFHP